MEIISKALKLTEEEYFKKHLLIINPLLPVQLTEKEIEVIATFMIMEEKLGPYVFDTTGRKEVRKKMKLSHGGLGNYLKDLKDKGYLMADEKYGLKILSILKPQKDWQGYQFKLTRS